MAIVPYLHELRRPWGLLDRHFDMNLAPEDMFECTPMLDFFRPWRHLAAALRHDGSSIRADKDKFEINLDVQHFSPDEITVKTGKGYVVVTGKHEEKRDEHGYVSREFTRRYALPKGCIEATVQSTLSSDGVLTVSAPRKVPLPNDGERIVPVQHTGPIKKQIGMQEDEENVVPESKKDKKMEVNNH